MDIPLPALMLVIHHKLAQLGYQTVGHLLFLEDSPPAHKYQLAYLFIYFRKFDADLLKIFLGGGAECSKERNFIQCKIVQ